MATAIDQLLAEARAYVTRLEALEELAALNVEPEAKPATVPAKAIPAHVVARSEANRKVAEANVSERERATLAKTAKKLLARMDAGEARKVLRVELRKLYSPAIARAIAANAVREARS